MRRLSSLGSKSLAHRKGRSVLTGAGIVLGVAIFFGVLASNATTQDGVDQLIEDFTGRADVVVDSQGAFSDVHARLDRCRSCGRFPTSSSPSAGSASAPSHRRRCESMTRTTSRRASSCAASSSPRNGSSSATRSTKGRFFTPGAPEMVVTHALVDDVPMKIGERVPIRRPPDARPSLSSAFWRRSGPVAASADPARSHHSRPHAPSPARARSTAGSLSCCPSGTDVDRLDLRARRRASREWASRTRTTSRRASRASWPSSARS